MPDTDTDTVDEIEIDADLADRLRDAQQAYDEVKEYLDGLKDQVKARYAERDKFIGTHGGQKVFTFDRRESTRLDRHRLKRDWPDIYNQYTKTVEALYVTVARPKADS